METHPEHVLQENPLEENIFAEIELPKSEDTTVVIPPNILRVCCFSAAHRKNCRLTGPNRSRRMTCMFSASFWTRESGSFSPTFRTNPRRNDTHSYALHDHTFVLPHTFSPNYLPFRYTPKI